VTGLSKVTSSLSEVIGFWDFLGSNVSLRLGIYIEVTLDLFLAMFGDIVEQGEDGTNNEVNSKVVIFLLCSVLF
jgi:hypothetical protein